jgi:hypothetical protein
MAFSIQCPACKRKLNVPDTLLGKRVKCPSCGEGFQASQTPSEAENAKKAKLPLTEGIAPAPKRSASPPPSKKVEEEPEAETEYENEEEEEPKPRARQRRSRDDDDEDGDERRPARRARREDDEDDDDYERPRRRRRRQPHRGGLVLTLAIVSMVVSCCALGGLIMGAIALNMANKDLSDMAAGRMDDSGYGITMAGKICAIIGLVLALISFIFGVIWQVALRQS